MERFFTWVSIARWHLERGTLLAGTMRHDKKDIPNEMTSVDKQKNYQEKLVLC